MKKRLSLLFILMLTWNTTFVVFAESIPMNTEDQLLNLVRNYLDTNEYEYEYEDYTFYTGFSLDCDLEYADMEIYIYDDMLAVAVDAPIQVSEENFEKAAVFTTLVNNDIYYAQFRVDRDSGYITCRSCNLVENVVPGEDELYYLIFEPLFYMEDYGNGIKIVCEGGDPYQVYESCLAK